MAVIGESGYRHGARERLEEAYTLLQEEQFSGSVYLAGRAVEGILRAVIWRGDTDYALGRKILETGHDLRDMLKLIQDLGMLRDSNLADAIRTDVQKVARLWSNNMRFWPTSMVNREWFALGTISRKRTMKLAAREYFLACSAILKRCEALWQS